MKYALLATLVLAVASPARAEPSKEKAAAEFAEGQRHFKAKEYVKAAERFKAALAADEDPVYLFNIAQALRHAKQCNESRDYYKKFLAAAAVVPNRDKVEKWLAEVEACATKEAPVEPKPVDHVTPKHVAPNSPPIKDPPRPTTPAPRADLGRGRRRAGLIAIAGGAIATGAGVFFTTRVGAAERDREALCPAPCTWSDAFAASERELDDKGKLNSSLAIASFAVGGAAIVGGVVLYLTGRNTGNERVAVMPTPGGAVARVGFAF